MSEYNEFINYFDTLEDAFAATFAHGYIGLPWQPTTADIILSPLRNTPSLLDTLHDEEAVPDEPLLLIGEACISDDTNGDRNCTQVCTDPETLFSSWLVQYTCLALAALALASPRISLNSSINASFDDALAPLALSMSNISDFNAIGVLNATYECAAASCRDKSIGDCSIGYPTSPSLTTDGAVNNSDGNYSWYDAFWPICTNLESNIDVDIAGPGVSVRISVCSFHFLSHSRSTNTKH